MIRRRDQTSIAPVGVLFQIVAACALGLILGVASAKTSPYLAAGLLAALVLGYAALRRPEIALLGILVATSSIVFEDQLPQFSLGFGSLHIPDLLLLGLLALIGIRWLVEPEFEIVKTPLDLPILAFYGVMLLATFIAIFQSSLDIEIARRMIRVVTYYFTFFAVTNLVRDRRQLKLLLEGFFFLATIVSVVMILQYLLGQSVTLLPGRVETLQTQGVSYYGITRIMPPGQSIIVVAFIALSAILVLDRTRPFNILQGLQWCLLGMAIVVSFTRSYWVQAGLALVIIFFVAQSRDKTNFLRVGLVAIVAGVIALTFALTSIKFEEKVTQLISASFNRAATLFQEDTLEERSLQPRYIENMYALQKIPSHPVLGLGLGAYYRPIDKRIDGSNSTIESTIWMHNGHLWIMLDSGLLGYGCFVWLSVTFLWRGFRNWRNVKDGYFRAALLGFVLVYLGTLISALLRPMFVEWHWTPVIGIILGVNEVILRKYGRSFE